MKQAEYPSTTEKFLSKIDFARIFDVLHQRGYQVIGPTIDQDAIVYDRIDSVDDLPKGWTDEQSPGMYRLKPRDDDTYFGYVVGPRSWKRFLFPPAVKLSTADKTASGWRFQTIDEDPPKFAFLGVRACELAAIGVQDRVFLTGSYIDPVYAARRRNSVIIAMNCTQAASTCFCTSMGTGPKCRSGFDIAMTELEDGFTVETASDEARAIVASLHTIDASIMKLQAAQKAQEQAVAQIEREFDTTDIRDLMMSNLEHSHWEDVAKRCLSCTNCTMVCPTCFCTSVEEVSDLKGEHVERQRQWDSCFNIEFSYMNGGSVRNDVRSRYRQWLTHKLASWIDQFGELGCVGCGRCITWCPVGIDLVDEVSAIRGGAE